MQLDLNCAIGFPLFSSLFFFYSPIFIMNSGCHFLSDNSVLFISLPPQYIALLLGGEDKSLVLLLHSLIFHVLLLAHTVFLLFYPFSLPHSSQKKLLPSARDLVDLSLLLIVNTPGHLQGFRFKENRNIQGISKSSLRAEARGHKTHCSPIKKVAWRQHWKETESTHWAWLPHSFQMVPPWGSSVSAHLLNRATDILCFGLSFQGCLHKNQS